MSFTRSAVAALLWAVLVGAAVADIVTHADGDPPFTPAEMHIVASDARLGSALRSDPWRLRKAFDQFAADDAGAADAADPRSSPEAALDLLHIIKQAGGGSTAQ